MIGKKLLKNKIENIKKRVIRLAHNTPAAHLGSCLSCIEILSYLLFNLKKNEKFLLEKGHVGLVYYSILIEKGIIGEDEIDLLDSKTHPVKNEFLEVEFTTGSLGHGLSVACGMAIANSKKRIYTLVSDGACDEGVIWECLRFATQRKLNNLRVIIDANGWSAYGKTTDLKTLAKRWRAFDWNVILFSQKDEMDFSKEFPKPTVYIVKTKKGKGFVEDKIESHYFKIEDYEKNIL